MKYFKKISTYTLLLFMGVALVTACSNNNHDNNGTNDNKDSKDQAEDMNAAKFDREGEKASDKLVDAYSMNLYEIRLSENAATKAVTAEVKKLAAMMVTAHTKMNAEIQKLAASKNISLPTDLSDGDRKDVDKYSDKMGVDYDKDYTKEMRDKHEDAIKKFEKTADNCDDADIKNFAAQSLPELRSHLDMVESTWNNIKDMKDDKGHDHNNHK